MIERMEGERSRVPAILVALWTLLALVGIVAVAATPDPWGLSGAIIAFLLFVWIAGLAAGAVITAVIRALRQRRN